jgi:hypothetical protein
MKSNAVTYGIFSIAIFPVNVSWLYKLFKRYILLYRIGLFCQNMQNIFLQRDPLYAKKHRYIIAKQPNFGLA